MFWHDRLGHPGSITMRRIIGHSYGHPKKNLKILLPSENTCVACSQGKLITKPSPSNVIESSSFLKRTQGDIYIYIYRHTHTLSLLVLCLEKTPTNSFGKKNSLSVCIYEPIHPPCRPFKYIMVLIDASSIWSHVCLLSS